MVMVGVWQDQQPGLWAGFSAGIFQKASQESRTEGWGSHRVSPARSRVEGAENLRLCPRSTSGPGDWHMRQHPSSCPCASRVPLSIQPRVSHPCPSTHPASCVSPSSAALGAGTGKPPQTYAGKGSGGGHRFTPQPTSLHRTSRCPGTHRVTWGQHAQSVPLRPPGSPGITGG